MVTVIIVGKRYAYTVMRIHHLIILITQSYMRSAMPYYTRWDTVDVMMKN